MSHYTSTSMQASLCKDTGGTPFSPVPQYACIDPLFVCAEFIEDKLY